MNRGTLLLAAVITAAATAGASAPSYAANAGVAARRSRTFVVSAGEGWDRVEVSLVHERGGAFASSREGGVIPESFYACAFGWTKTAFFSGCAQVDGSSVNVSDNSASGTLKFTVTDGYRGGSAVVDLKLVETPNSMAPSYHVDPEAGTGYAESAASAILTRTAKATGTVKVTTVRYRNKTERKTFSVSAPMRVDDRVRAAASASA